MKYNKKIYGELFGWFETGTEGVIPALQSFDSISKDGFYDYSGLNVIQDGDHLTIHYANEKNPRTKRIVWHGVIKMLPAYMLIEDMKNNTRGADDLVSHLLKNGIFVHKEYGQFIVNGMYTSYIPMNFDLKVFSRVFFTERKRPYRGILKKKMKETRKI